jgi:hypothetical protein
LVDQDLTVEIRRGRQTCVSLTFTFLLLFERGRNMPHFSAVRSGWEKACADCKLAAFDSNRYFRAAGERTGEHDPRLIAGAFDPPCRPGRPKADKESEALILRVWLHAGAWMFSHEDRALYIQYLFKPKNPFGTDGLRKRCMRLGLLGWSDFPQTYRKAPLSVADRDKSKVVSISPDWETYFA